MKAPFQCYKHSKTLPIILMLRGIMRMVPLCNHRGINSQFSSVHGLNWCPPPHAQFAPSRRRLKVRANSLVHWKHGRTVSAEHCVCRQLWSHKHAANVVVVPFYRQDHRPMAGGNALYTRTSYDLQSICAHKDLLLTEGPHQSSFEWSPCQSSSARPRPLSVSFIDKPLLTIPL